MREAYTSDISRRQYEVIAKELEGAKKRTKPREIDLYEVLCAILYILKNGSRWRDLPHDYPKWKSVYYYYMVWTRKNEKGISILDRVRAKLVDMERSAAGRNPEPSMLIVDSKSVQNADTAEEAGYDAGKKHQE